jgi:uncharacterized membrane protein
LADADTGLATHYVDASSAIRTALLIHAASGGLALALTPVQASRTVRRRWPVAHRLGGRVSAAAIAVGAVSGLVIAPGGYAGLSGAVGFSALSVIWAYCLFRAIAAARGRRLAEHRRWGVRVMALTFAAVTLRLWLVGYISVAVPVGGVDLDTAFDQIYSVTPFLSWVPNLALAEWYLRRKSAA